MSDARAVMEADPVTASGIVRGEWPLRAAFLRGRA